MLISQLRELDLSGAACLSDRALATVLSHAHHLQRLNLSDVPTVSWRTLDELARTCAELRWLDLSQAGMDEDFDENHDEEEDEESREDLENEDADERDDDDGKSVQSSQRSATLHVIDPADSAVRLIQWLKSSCRQLVTIHMQDFQLSPRLLRGLARLQFRI